MRRALVLFVLVVAAACGGDDGEDSAGTTSSTTTEATTTTGPTTTTLGPAVTGDVEPAVDPVGEVVDGSLTTPDGRTRTYRLYVPSELADDAPLVLALHGGTGNGAQFAGTSGYDGLAEANGFLVAYPDGTPTAIGPRNLVWNAAGCCAAAVAQDVDDVGFLTALVEQLAEERGIDPTRVLVTGHSNGAMMALRLACEAADHVAAVAVEAGTVFVDDCTPSRPVSALDLHGTDDRNLPLDGGVGADSTVGLDFPPVRDGLATFADVAGCDHADAPTTRDTTQDDVTVESWGPCPDGVDVELVVVEGAGHSWMGHPAPRPGSDQPYQDVDASLLTWTFLAAHA